MTETFKIFILVGMYTPEGEPVESGSVSIFWPNTPACNTQKWLGSCTVQFTVLVRQQKIQKIFTPPLLNGVLHYRPFGRVGEGSVAAGGGCLLGKRGQKTVFATNAVYNGFSIIIGVSRPFLANDSRAQPHYASKLMPHTLYAANSTICVRVPHPMTATAVFPRFRALHVRIL